MLLGSGRTLTLAVASIICQTTDRNITFANGPHKLIIADMAEAAS
jgi:hypothetical protein